VYVQQFIDKIVSECLPSLSLRNLKHFEISTPYTSTQRLVSKTAAEYFFKEILCYQRQLKEITLSNANLSSSSMLALLSTVIVHVPQDQSRQSNGQSQFKNT